MTFRLRYQQQEFELLEGEFLIGRSADCRLALDDVLVSRKHALLVLTRDTLVVKDLGSRNGVVVNGIRIDESRVLIDGDKVVIGSQEMFVSCPRPQRVDTRQQARSVARSMTLTATQGTAIAEAVKPASPPTVDAPSKPRDAPKRVDSFPLLASLADKALALGRNEDAERILSSVMAELLRNVQNREPGGADILDEAARYAVRLAGATGKGSWVDYVVALYTAVRRPCPAFVVDELHVVVRKTTAVDIASFRAYLDVLREGSAELGPADRFLVQRIEGLERLASLR
jgi:pSer/pThr/pTyr-binding forkhead associated (FHA) protein